MHFVLFRLYNLSVEESFTYTQSFIFSFIIIHLFYFICFFLNGWWPPERELGGYKCLAIMLHSQIVHLYTHFPGSVSISWLLQCLGMPYFLWGVISRSFTNSSRLCKETDELSVSHREFMFCCINICRNQLTFQITTPQKIYLWPPLQPICLCIM